MYIIIDKLMLFGLCLITMSITEVQWISVVFMLSALAVSSLISYFEGVVSICLSISFVAMCFIIPGLFVFLPLIVYDLAGMKKWIFRLCWSAALPVCFINSGWLIAAIVALASGIAYLLQYRSSAELKTRSAFFALTDDAKEQSALLEHRQRELLDKKEYEVRLATLAERNRIAREIHDNVGHLLTRSILQLGALRVTHTGDGELQNELGLVNKTLSDAMDSNRDSVHNLHDESVNLKLRLEALINGFEFCHVTMRYDAGELPVGLRICFVAVVREALSNIARHSNATEAVVAVIEHPAFCQLIIKDNGTVNPDGTVNGIGLQNMADRVNAFGGIFRTEFDNGFRIFISVPTEVAL